MRILLAALLVFPALALADGAVLLFPAIGGLNRVTVSGRAFKDEASGSTALTRNVRRLAAPNWEGAAVEVRYAAQSKNVVSGADGHFEAIFEVAAPKTFAITDQKAEARINGVKTATAWVEIVPPTAPFFVVSDFDDTLAVSDVLVRRKLLANALLRDEKTQAVVPGMSAFYACLRDNPDKPSFALVSGSPAQFAPRIAAFLDKHKFPPMGLYLRDLSSLTLTNYKQPMIRGLLRGLPNKAVLVGDSGEHDPEVYRQMMEEFPGRILRAYIRNAGRTEDKARFEGLLLFDEPKQAALDAVSKGLASKECVEGAFP